MGDHDHCAETAALRLQLQQLLESKQAEKAEHQRMVMQLQLQRQVDLVRPRCDPISKRAFSGAVRISGTNTPASAETNNRNLATPRRAWPGTTSGPCSVPGQEVRRGVSSNSNQLPILILQNGAEPLILA